LEAREGVRSYRDLYENISEGVFRSTLDGRMISANPSLVRLNGYETEEQLLKAVNSIADEWYVDPNRRAEIHRMMLETGRVSNCVSEIYRHHTRERIWIEENTRLVRDEETGTPLYYDGTVREVTETVRRLELQEHYDKIASIAEACLYRYRQTRDGHFSLPYASVGLLHIFGMLPEDVREDASPLLALTHPEDEPTYSLPSSLRAKP
jgi:PAS domain S-box-containing protein